MNSDELLMRSSETEPAFHLDANVLAHHPHHRAAEDRVRVGEQLHP